MVPERKRILIVGGVAGGASFAARMRRHDESAHIIMFEKGEYISFANCGLPYHIGGVIPRRRSLVIQTPESFGTRYNVDVRTGARVTGVDTTAQTITVATTQGTTAEPYDTLLLAPGSFPVRPPLPGIDADGIFTLRTLHDMDRIIDHTRDSGGGRYVVIGGGFIGLEMAENLRHIGKEVTLVELGDQLFAPMDREMARVIEQHLLLKGVEVLLGNAVASFAEGEDGGLAVVLADNARLQARGVILAIGVRPDTAFLKGSGIELAPGGAIVVNEQMRTSCDHVYAVGDAVEVTDFVAGVATSIPLAGPANRQARVAADAVAGIASTWKHTQGTAVCRIFDMTAAVTGVNEKNARRYALPHLCSYTHSVNHASYYPGAFPMSVKLVFDPVSGVVLGAQIVGRDGVDKRIDVLAAAVRHRLTVAQLGELELAYAPPYGSAKDPVNMAGFVAQNMLSGAMPCCFPDDVVQRDPVSTLLLDVRTADEFEQGAIEGAVLLPLDELRHRLGELDKTKEILVYCQIGVRGYLATRILVQHGFGARNLSGGYKTWSLCRTRDYDTSYLRTMDRPSCSSPETDRERSVVHTVDARGLQCPGPVLELKKGVEQIREGEQVEIRATDMGFALDVPSWCRATGNTLVSVREEDGEVIAVVLKGSSDTSCAVSPPGAGKTLVVFSNDFDRAMAAFIIANGAAAQGSAVTLFFTFWGITLLRRDAAVPVAKTVTEKMFGAMMPRGPARLVLSKMNMGGLGTWMMQREMKKKKVFSLPRLIAQAQSSGVKLVACAMSMDIMGIKREELIDGVEFGGVAMYLDRAAGSSFNLFI